MCQSNHSSVAQGLRVSPGGVRRKLSCEALAWKGQWPWSHKMLLVLAVPLPTCCVASGKPLSPLSWRCLVCHSGICPASLPCTLVEHREAGALVEWEAQTSGGWDGQTRLLFEVNVSLQKMYRKQGLSSQAHPPRIFPWFQSHHTRTVFEGKLF